MDLTRVLKTKQRKTNLTASRATLLNYALLANIPIHSTPYPEPEFVHLCERHLLAGVLVVALEDVERHLLGSRGLERRALLGDLAGLLEADVAGDPGLDGLGEDDAGLVHESRLLGEAEEVLLQFVVVDELAFTRLVDEVLADAGFLLAILAEFAQLGLLLVGKGLEGME